MSEFDNPESHEFVGLHPLADKQAELTHPANLALHSASFFANLSKVKFCVEVLKCNPLHLNKEGNTALHTAAGAGHLSVMRYFVEERGCNPACVSSNGKTPLHVAAYNGCQNIVDYLLGWHTTSRASLS